MPTLDMQKIIELSERGIITWKKKLFGIYESQNFDLKLKLKSDSYSPKMFINGKRYLTASDYYLQKDIRELMAVINTYQANLLSCPEKTQEKILFIEQALKEIEFGDKSV